MFQNILNKVDQNLKIISHIAQYVLDLSSCIHQNVWVHMKQNVNGDSQGEFVIVICS